eukprot:3616426-Alexandrium_andersonii.AAC.1
MQHWLARRACSPCDCGWADIHTALRAAELRCVPASGVHQLRVFLLASVARGRTLADSRVAMLYVLGGSLGHAVKWIKPSGFANTSNAECAPTCSRCRATCCEV